MVNKKILLQGGVDPELVKEYGPSILKYIGRPYDYHFVTFLKEKDINLLWEKTREYYTTPFYPGKRSALVHTWKEVAERTGIICINEYYIFLRKGKATDYNLKMAYQVLTPGLKTCRGDRFHHVLSCYKGESSLGIVLCDYEEINGIVQKNKSFFVTAHTKPISTLCKNQYNLCKRYGEQKRVDFLPIESEDVRNYIKTFL